ncbi:MAG: ABC transporter ATP-binding protein [Anderseniella sp.]
MAALLELNNLVKRFQTFTAVNGISLEVPAGEVLGFLGPNGAGKSTTMKMAVGFLTPDEGNALICGVDVSVNPGEARQYLGYLPEGAPAYGEMSVGAFLKFCASMRGLSGVQGGKAIDRAVERTELGAVLEQPIETMSKGFKRRVGLAQAIMHEPKVLILDEPTDGLDPNQKHQVRQLIRDMSADRAIIISTHILEEVDAVCSRAVIIDQGRIVADGTASDLRKLGPGKSSSLEEAFRHVTLPVLAGGA